MWLPNVTGPTDLTVGRAVDWRFAVTVGTRLARPGPPCTGYTRRQVITELDAAATTAGPLVTEVTGLTPVTATPDTAVVDRPGWIASAADSMRVMTGGADTARGFVSGHLAGAQTGAVLAFVASGILGQYDPLAADGAGRLLLVYPNVIAVERQLRVDPHDFRLWVCLHEVTHRVQFTANPWLVEHMADALGCSPPTAVSTSPRWRAASPNSPAPGATEPTRTPPASSGWCGPCNRSRSATPSTGCWCSAPCWRATPIT